MNLQDVIERIREQDRQLAEVLSRCAVGFDPATSKVELDPNISPGDRAHLEKAGPISYEFLTDSPVIGEWLSSKGKAGPPK